ncbi:MAG: DNA repair protein RadA [Myxococcales bacterium]|nr:DNA repair protein RadA [Myxococcales bacterium]
MARSRSFWRCSACQESTVRWAGKCPHCGAWNALEEVTEAAAREAAAVAASAGAAANPAAVLRLRDARMPEVPRLATGFDELDRVLGGGIVPGSVVLLGGDPGIGKSTLLLQAAAQLLALGRSVLYVAGEENPAQLALRARRVGLATADLLVTTETTVEPLVALLESDPPDVLIVDSIQTMFTADGSSSPPGSVNQLKAVTHELTQVARSKNIASILVGHVTRSGSIAGPRVVEHLVDTVLYLEGDPGGALRLLRSVKNRFGSTLEVGIFQMARDGMQDAPLSATEVPAMRDRPAGVAITATLEGTRAFNIEVQSLVAPSVYGPPRLTVVGADSPRIQMLAAILERQVGDSVAGADLYVNVTGGLRIHDSATDLAMVCAMVSSLRRRPLPGQLWVAGELGLTGELRPVTGLPQRISAAIRAGYRAAIIPAGDESPGELPRGFELHRAGRLDQALQLAFV